MAALLLSACSQDELAEQSTTLPEGEYPLQIGGVSISAEASEQPWTRMTESTDGQSSQWQLGDEFQVKFNDYEEVGTYRIADDGATVEAVTPIYWKNTAQNGNITAWYTSPSPSVDGTIDLSDQTNGLAYVLQAKATATLGSTTSLPFTHQLAKIRVVLSGTQFGKVEKVEVHNYTSCTHTQDGSVTGSTEGWITMHKVNATTYEANVVPVSAIPNDFIRINGQQATVSNITTLTQGAVHTINLTVGQQLIDISNYEGTTLTIGGETTLTGTKDNIRVVLEDGAKVTLQDANLSRAGGGGVIKIGKGATCTLTLSGTNTLTTTSDPFGQYDEDHGYTHGITVDGGSLTIDSDPGAKLTINREGNGFAGCGIRVTNGGALIINDGDITIGGRDDIGTCGAGIGELWGITSSGESNVTINGGTIFVGQSGRNNIPIGGNNDFDIDINITIAGESTVVTVEKGQYVDYYIGYTTGDIYIGGGATVNGVKYTDEEPHTGPL